MSSALNGLGLFLFYNRIGKVASKIVRSNAKNARRLTVAAVHTGRAGPVFKGRPSQVRPLRRHLMKDRTNKGTGEDMPPVPL